MLKDSKGKTLNLAKAKEIAAGGEGKIYEHPTDKKKVVKIYHQPRKKEYADHLKLLSGLGNRFVEPKEIYFTDKGQCAGFDMNYVNFSHYWLFNNLFNKGFCNSNGIDKSFKLKVLQELSEAINEVHSKGIVIGDLNQYNIFVGKNGTILFVDTDSYASTVYPHSGVILDDIRDWTTLDINKSTDSWSYDILAFWITTFCHPFKWIMPGNKDTLEQRVKKNMSFLRDMPGLKIPPLYEAPTGDEKKQFLEIFSGRRYMVNLSGQHVQVNVQIKQQVGSKNLEIRELYDHVTKILNAGSCISAKINGKWSIIETSLPKITRMTTSVDDCDVLLPSKSNYAYIKGNVLYSHDGKENKFYQPEFYYDNCSLMCIDYAQDLQYNFNLNSQMWNISNNNLVVFSKSIVVGNTPIQNFGAQKFLNIPIGTSYTMIGVPIETKNAIYCNNFWAIEMRKKNKVEYELRTSTQSMSLEYLPSFAVRGKVVLIPENGYIDVYQDMTKIVELDCLMCTRDSQLFSTDSGILLLENNVLYLLNTK